jgi:Lysylphosphatidylglycerol synthase TM region
MSKQRKRQALRLLAMAAGSGLIAYLILRAGRRNLWQELLKLGWGFALVIALAGVAHLVKAWAWQMTLGKDRHRFSFMRLLGLRLASEAAAQLGILGQTFGDSIRVSQLSRGVQMANSLASVTMDRGFFIVSGIVVAMGGILAALPALSQSHVLRLYAALFIFGAAAFLLLMLLAVRKRWPVLSGAARKLGRIPSLGRWVIRKLDLIQSMEDALFDFHHKTPLLFWGSFALNLVGQCLAILEVCVVLWLLGVHIGFIGALIVEGLTKFLNAIGNFNPGNVGTYEGGNILIGKIFSLSSATGLALARRLRALFWTAAGCICLVMLTRSKKLEGLGNVVKYTKSTEASSEVSNSFRSGGVGFAIFLPPADSGLPLARVGSLPLALRIILAAKK